MNAAKQALDNYSKLSDEEKDPGTEESLYSDYQSKKSMYDSVVAESKDTVDLDRALQDAKDSLKIDEYNKELAKLQPLLDAGGKITSEKEGIVTSVVAENGGVTTDTIASIADKNEGYKFVGQIDKENRTSIKQGQSVAVNLGTYGIIENLTIDSISKNQDNADTLNVTVVLPVGIGEIKIDEYNKELAKLQPLLDAGGKITSEKEGIVTSVVAENGGVTTDTIASIADKNEGYKFVGQIDKENRTSIKQGQSVAVNLGTYGIIENLTIDSISKNQDNADTLNVTVVLPVGIGEIDDSGEIIVSSKSKKYGTCVPLAALRQGEGSDYYVLVVTEKETVLGEELTAKKVDVKVEKRDGEYAAVTEGTLGRNDKIIIDSNKTVEDGDRVRLETE